MLNPNQILDILPHRYPMLLVDRVEEITADRVVGVKNVSANEPFFQGHFPGFPVMPGVLILESMAQVGAVWLLSQVADREDQLRDKVVLFAAIEQARFRKPVFPGDKLRIEMSLLKRKATVCKMRAKASVSGRLVAEAVLTCQVAEKSTVAPEPSPSSSISELEKL